MYRHRHGNARGSGIGRSASWRECTRTRELARTAPSSGGCLKNETDKQVITLER